MGLVAVQRRYFIQFKELSIHPDLSVSSLAHLFQKLFVMTFSASDHWSKKIAFAAGVILHYERDDLLVCISYHLFSGLRRICSGCPCIQQTQEVINFSDCADCRSRVVSGCLLLDGNYRA